MLNEKEMDFLENQIPILAEFATKQAYWHALSAGSSVLIAQEGQLIEVFPDGSRIVRKEIPKSVKITNRTITISK